MLTLQAYEQWIRNSIASDMQSSYHPHTDSNWPGKNEMKEKRQRWLAVEQEKVRKVFGQDGEQVISDDDLERELEERFDKLFNEVYDSRFRKIQQDYKIRFEESRKRNQERAKNKAAS